MRSTRRGSGGGFAPLDDLANSSTGFYDSFASNSTDERRASLKATSKKKTQFWAPTMVNNNMALFKKLPKVRSSAGIPMLEQLERRKNTVRLSACFKSPGTSMPPTGRHGSHLSQQGTWALRHSMLQYR